RRRRLTRPHGAPVGELLPNVELREHGMPVLLPTCVKLAGGPFRISFRGTHVPTVHACSQPCRARACEGPQVAYDVVERERFGLREIGFLIMDSCQFEP